MKKKKRQMIWLFAAIGVILIGAGIYGYLNNWFPGQKASAAEATEENQINTAIVRRGDIMISASGSGEVIPAEEQELGFATSTSKLAELYISIGDLVSEGDVLAKANNADELEAIVKSAEIDLQLAQEELDNFYESGENAIALAELSLANAKVDLDDAQTIDYYTFTYRCDDTTIELYEVYYEDAVEDRIDAEEDNDGSTRALEKLISAESTEQSALANLNYCKGMTDENDAAIATADLTIAKIAVLEAEDTLNTLLENDGLDPIEKLQLELSVANAELSLQTAQDDLDNAILTAPMDGIITTLSADVGETVGSQSFITVSDLQNATVSVYLDETDMDNMAVGYEIEVEFDAIPDRIFTGTITTVYPSLQSSGQMNVVYGEAVLSQESMTGIDYLLEGLNAAIEVIGGRSEDALLVPVEALRDLGDGTYAVFVLPEGADEPRMTFVEVGLMDYYYAEILSGLEVGDVVTTGIVEVE